MSQRTPPQDLDRRLPSPAEKAVLRHWVQDGILEFVAEGNTGFNEDGNWRIRLSDSTLYVEAHTGGTWVEIVKHEA
jgi:hypothetical protein